MNTDLFGKPLAGYPKYNLSLYQKRQATLLYHWMSRQYHQKLLDMINLPIDGEDVRAGSAVKEPWNNDGRYVDLRVPPKGDPVWKELHAIQEKAAGGPVPYVEELKFWEGPVASQVYEIELKDGKKIADKWYLSGGKPQQFFDRDQMKLLKERGFVSEREATNFPDFDPVVGNIAPKDGPYFEVIPLDEAVPPARTAKK
jgi:hypothetical protein